MRLAANLLCLRFKSGTVLIVSIVLLGLATRQRVLRRYRGQQLHVAGSLSVHRYQGAERVQFRVIDVALLNQGPSVIR